MGYNNFGVEGFTGMDAKQGNGSAYFTLCESYKTKSGAEHKNWFRVVGFKEYIQRRILEIRKGDLIRVDGRLDIREYEDENGVQRRQVDIIASHVAILRKPPKRAADQQEDSNDDLGGFGS